MSKKFRISVQKVTGNCIYGLKQGQKFIFDGLNTPDGGFCGGAYHAIFPYLVMLNFNGKFPACTDNIVLASCADGGKVTLGIEIYEGEEIDGQL
jgi:uncharacterized repeat protein (TIGR04076 family)